MRAHQIPSQHRKGGQRGRPAGKPSGSATSGTSESARKYTLLSKYGLDEEELARLFRAQDGVCAVCHRAGHISDVSGRGARKNAEGLPQLCVDHCHATGKVRGLLCQACNIVVGNNGPRRLVRAAFYVQEFEKTLSAEERDEVLSFRECKGLE